MLFFFLPEQIYRILAYGEGGLYSILTNAKKYELQYTYLM